MFCRFAICRPDRPNAVLVEYVGDARVAAQFPHGNATSSSHNYIRTQPHVLHDIRAQSGSSKNVYRTLVSAASQAQQPVAVTAAPRNCEQIRNPMKHNDVVTNSKENCNLTAAERASVVINSGQISFDAKLSIFTVNGTTEPRVVRLFPSVTCSCPAKGNCYHVLAAKMALGMSCDSKKRTINLTQLRKNKRKRPDKTSGRKRSRADDMDVVPPDDHDDAETAALIAAISQPRATLPPPASPPAPLPSPPVIRTDICHACDAVNPPPRKSRRIRIVQWVGCDQCVRWYHAVCLGIKEIPDSYVCDLCTVR